MTTETLLPQDVTALEIAFGGAGLLEKLLPPMDAIPEEFRRHRSSWVDWQSDWFFNGLKRYPIPKPGIDVDKAMGHLSAIQSSWEPKHEHKKAGVAYLASLWFASPDGEPIQ